MGGDPRDVPAARAAAEAAHRAVRSGERRGPGNPSAAEDVALVARRNEPLLDMKQRTTHEDPNFMETFFKASRLHYIGTWKHRYEAFLEDLPPAPKLPAPEGGPGGERVILHVDMDCFFASVAALGRPELAGLPVAVSWSSVGGGELSSCNYLARNAGCRAGMRIARAKELCPNLIVMPYEFERYSTVAIDVYRTLHELSPHVMGVSVDEAYVDVTGLAACGRKTPREIAEDVRAKIFAKTGCVASVGSGPNRLIARLATKRAKPDGSHHVPASNASSFLASMPVAELPGVGRGTLEKLRREGICSAVGGVGPNTADPTWRGRRRRAALGSAARSGAQGGGAAQGRVTGDRRSRVGGETPAQVGGGAGDVGGSFRGGVGGCRVRGEAVRRGERAHATAEGQGTHADAQDPSCGGQRAGDTHERVHRPRRVRPSHPIEHRVFERRRRPVALAGGGAPARRPQRPRGSDPGRGGSGHEA